MIDLLLCYRCGRPHGFQDGRDQVSATGAVRRICDRCIDEVVGVELKTLEEEIGGMHEHCRAPRICLNLMQCHSWLTCLEGCEARSHRLEKEASERMSMEDRSRA